MRERLVQRPILVLMILMMLIIEGPSFNCKRQLGGWRVNVNQSQTSADRCVCIHCERWDVLLLTMPSMSE